MVKTLGKVCMNPVGEYSASTSYEKLDVVYYGGNSYLAKQNSTGQTPANNSGYWQCLGGKGEPGLTDEEKQQLFDTANSAGTQIEDFKELVSSIISELDAKQKNEAEVIAAAISEFKSEN